MHRATYANLDAGNYVFKVRAANADGIWSDKRLLDPVDCDRQIYARIQALHAQVRDELQIEMRRSA